MDIISSWYHQVTDALRNLLTAMWEQTEAEDRAPYEKKEQDDRARYCNFPLLYFTVPRNFAGIVSKKGKSVPSVLPVCNCRQLLVVHMLIATALSTYIIAGSKAFSSARTNQIRARDGCVGGCQSFAGHQRD